MGTDSGDLPEFSYVVHPSEIGEIEQVYELTADSRECKALARRFDLLAIESFRPRLTLKRLQGGTAFRLLGQVRARVTQRCVVTLVPVVGDVDSRFETIFRNNFQWDKGEMAVEDDVEPLEGDILDLGEIAAEELVLALDPYPRAPGVELSDFALRDDQEESRKHPFAALAALKGKK